MVMGPCLHCVLNSPNTQLIRGLQRPFKAAARKNVLPIAGVLSAALLTGRPFMQSAQGNGLNKTKW